MGELINCFCAGVCDPSHVFGVKSVECHLFIFRGDVFDPVHVGDNARFDVCGFPVEAVGQLHLKQSILYIVETSAQSAVHLLSLGSFYDFVAVPPFGRDGQASVDNEILTSWQVNPVIERVFT